MSGNTLVAPTAESSDAFAGAGIFSDAANTVSDGGDHNWLGLGIDVAADGLDALGMVMDPLGSLASAGVGWLIEHISFLKEGLDLLAGDPNEVTAKAQTWQNISQSLSSTADEYRKAAKNVAGSWKSPKSGKAYQVTNESLAVVLTGGAAEAAAASKAMTVAAALVGTERGLIRDLISTFVGELIIKAVAALASSWCSFGASIAAFIADTVAEGAILAEKISSRIAKVVSKLETLAKDAGKSKGILEAAAKGLKKVGKGADTVASKARGAEKNLNKTAENLTKKSEDFAKKDAQAAEAGAQKAKEAGKSEALGRAKGRWEEAGKRGKAWKEDFQSNTTGRVVNKPGVHNKLNEWNEKVGEEGRSALDPKKWAEQGRGYRHDGWDTPVPKWSTGDSVGAGTELGRQVDDQRVRQDDTEDAYKEQQEGAEGLTGHMSGNIKPK